MGHVNNAVYVTYLEVGREAYWRALEGNTDYGAVPFILAHVSIDFRAETLVHEELDVGVRCDWVGQRSFHFSYQIRERASGRLCVEATSVQVCYDYAAKRSIPCPPELKAKLEALEGHDLTRR